MQSCYSFNPIVEICLTLSFTYYICPIFPPEFKSMVNYMALGTDLHITTIIISKIVQQHPPQLKLHHPLLHNW